MFVKICQRQYIKCRLFVGMGLLYGCYQLCLQPARKYGFYFYFIFLLLLANFAYKRLGIRACFKSSRACCIETAFTVIANMAGACFKNSIAHLCCVLLGHKNM